MAVIKPQFTLRLDETVHAKIKKMAKSQTRSMTNMIEFILKKEIDAYEKEHGEIEITDEDLSIE